MSGCNAPTLCRPQCICNLSIPAAALMQVEVLIGLVIGYPAMLWVVGGGWWGLTGMVLHLVLLLKVQPSIACIVQGSVFVT